MSKRSAIKWLRRGEDRLSKVKTAILLCVSMLIQTGCGAAAPSGAPGSAAAESRGPAPSEVAAGPSVAATVPPAQATFVAARATVTAAAASKPGVSSALAAASAAPASRALSTTDLAEIGRLGTVLLTMPDRSLGSGAYLGESSVLTAAHVAAGPQPISVTFDGRPVGNAEITAVNMDIDLALLNVRGLSLGGPRALTWGDSATLRSGDSIMVVGFPAGVGLTVTQGIFSGLRQVTGRTLLQTDAAVNPGNSGGPMLNARGELVAIAIAGLCGTTGLNFGVASGTARPFVQAGPQASVGPLTRKKSSC